MKREFTQEQKDVFKEKALQAKKEVAAMEADNMSFSHSIKCFLFYYRF